MLGQAIFFHNNLGYEIYSKSSSYFVSQKFAKTVGFDVNYFSNAVNSVNTDTGVVGGGGGV